MQLGPSMKAQKEELRKPSGSPQEAPRKPSGRPQEGLKKSLLQYLSLLDALSEKGPIKFVYFSAK